jgi:two-component system, LytTR family, response regulator
MITALIIDDEVNNTTLLDYFIGKYCPEINETITANSLEEAVTQFSGASQRINIVFIDIELNNGASGFDFLNTLDCESVQIIFVTAYNEYAIKAFKYNAVDYLIKPLNIEDLQLAVKNACKRMEKGVNRQLNRLLQDAEWKKLFKPSKFIAVASVNKIEILAKEDIEHIRSDGKYSTFFTLTGKHESSRNLGEYEQLLLNDEMFIRVHHSYIVNLNFVKQIKKEVGWTCLMNSGFPVPVSRRKQDELTKALNLKS